ncbi:DNA-binding protein YbiB [Candidatus Tachikawaea gelatinosa]|uniref:Anthranilate phosphoribosyltransferase YbiB n=1 Tax=Candidatus Tachikawaea gelatinosa TaxID=1410383 RepID=A0A090AM27_9ENTR|nr:DNA-binding protein YbiB [Candidatus Tachikawaea gelatinosa]BAP58709.1 anthranilate phosphoribosyltransferase YbiB [Candidatus Tachikawaea gelatinosa]
MNIQKIIKKIIRKKNDYSMTFNDSKKLYQCILENKIADLELGTLLLAIRSKGESIKELHGFYCAMQEKISCFRIKTKNIVAIIPSYNGARRQCNLTPLLAILLNKLDFPVLVHGVTEDPTRIISKDIFKYFQIFPTSDFLVAEKKINNHELVFMPIENLCKSIANQVSLRWRTNMRNSSHILAKLIYPFNINQAIRFVSVSHPKYFNLIKMLFRKTNESVLLTYGNEGEVSIHPNKSQKITFIYGNKFEKIFFYDYKEKKTLLPSKNIQETISWMKKIIKKLLPMPPSIRFQIASYCVASKVCSSFEEAFLKIKKKGY